MNKIYSIAKYGLIQILGLTILFHFLVISNVIPYHLVWGGNLKEYKEMLKFEIVSIIINSIFLLVVLVKTKLVKWNVHTAIITTLLWMMVFVFTLNTIGNIFSKHSLETAIFTPITALMSAFSLVLILKRES